MKDADKKRKDFIEKMKSENSKLDVREEKLKTRVDLFQNEIDDYNRRIDELNTGFGFLVNFFHMRNIQKKKDSLLEKQKSIIEEIDDVRTVWEDRLKAYRGETEKIENEWKDARVDLSMISEKVETLKKNRDVIIKRAAFGVSLGTLSGGEKYISSGRAGGPEKCRRCGSENTSNMFFCRYCGERFSDDRKDIMGSLGEVGELNAVYRDLEAGMKQSVSFLALMKGLKKGLEAMKKSVSSVKESQDKYSALPKLKIDVPGESRDLSRRIGQLEDEIDVSFYNLHPGEFSQSFKKYSDGVFTDKNIEVFFKKIGDELNSTTKAQWK